jgi:hypothetical protein
VFAAAEKLARRAGRSRSEVYGAALREYVARHAPDAVTEVFDHVCSTIEDDDTAFRRAAPHRARADRMVIWQGEVWWAELTEPARSAPGSDGRSSSFREMPSTAAGWRPSPASL